MFAWSGCASCSSLLYIGISSSSTGLLFYSSNNLPVGEDLLHSTDERCSQEEDRCFTEGRRCVKRSLRLWQGMVPVLLRWKTAWHDHPMFSFTPCRCSFSRRPATYFWQFLKEALVFTQTASLYRQKIFLQKSYCPRRDMGLSDNKCDKKIINESDKTHST